MAESITEFPFPRNVTRSERRLYEEAAGSAFNMLAKKMQEDPHSILVAEEDALLLVAVRRAIPTATIEDVRNHDEWLMTQDDSDGAEGDLPAPLPEPTDANS